MELAPSYRLRLATRKRVNQWRLNIDVIGLTVVKLFGPWLWMVTWLHPVLQIYPMLATFVILTLDPKRLPEFSTTRIHQRQAWRWMLIMLPAFTLLTGIIWQVTHTNIAVHPVTISALAGTAWSSYFQELFWRNILQPKLRQVGLGRIQAIMAQTTLFSASFAISHHTGGVVLSAFVLGGFNGWIVYRYRTMWPGFVLTSVWALFAL